MAKISLREYIHKIESLIDRGEIDQAIFHCKSILKSYPKHIDSYRLLGKAFLEKKKFGDAADIFQRVLSSVADDFISHIGMSVIREDENNLDEAIWHMERAFETQPSNKTVQEELMKLYSVRDGVTPHKIRLTRGALVRMYLKGELYSQAIAEIQAALNEDPNRVDLEVVLAQLYNLTGQKIEAMEICSKLISKLPYCFEANLILTELLPGTGRSEDEKIFRQRLIELDPYFEFVESPNTSSNDIPDNKIMLDYIDYDGTQYDQIKSDWADSLGLDIEEEVASENEEPDDWFNFEQPSEENQIVSDTIESDISVESNDETIISDTTRTDLSELLKSDEKDEPLIPDFNEDKGDSVLPDWIKDAGWNQAEEENIEIQKGFNIIEENDSEITEQIDDTDQVEIEPGEIPEWLKEIAPTDKIEDLKNIDEEDGNYEDDEEFENLFDRLSEQDEGGLKENLDPSLEWLREFQAEENDEVELFKEEAEIEELQLSDSDSTIDENISEKEMDIEEFQLSGSDSIITEDISEDEMDSVVESEIFKVEEIDNLEPELNEEQEIISEDSIEIEPSDDVVSAINKIDVISEEEELLEKETESDMSWLEAISENEILNQNENQKIQDGNLEIPEWMKALDEGEATTELQGDQEIKTVMTDDDLESENTFDLPDWLKLDEESEVVESEENIEKIPAGEPEEKQLTGMDEIDEELEKTFEDLPQPNSEIEEEILAKSDSSEEEISGEIRKSEQNVFEEVSDLEQEDINSALTWMESLAIKHGATEDTLLSRPEERDENPPDWIKALSSYGQEETSQIINENEEFQDFEKNQENLTPDWLQALQIETNDVETTDYETEDLNDVSQGEVETTYPGFDSVSSDAVDQEIEELLRETGKLPGSLKEEPLTEIESPIVEHDQSEQELDIIDDFEVEAEISQDMDEEQPAEIEKQIVEHDQIEQEIKIHDELEVEAEISQNMDEKHEFSEIASPGEETPISKSSQERLDIAKQLIIKGKIDDALEIYNEFIHAELVLDKVIVDLQDALNNKYPIDINLWQALGDAQLRNNQLQEALNSYTKAEELLS